MTSPKRPRNAIVVKTYADFDRYVTAWADGCLNLLILVSRPGLGKSSAVRQALGQRVLWLEGNATPFRIYCSLWKWRHEPIVIDDVDSLYADRSSVRLLKSLCQTEQIKTVSWLTNSATLEKEGIPRQFDTTSRVVIIANEWKTLNANVQAVEDRGHLIMFEPTALEIHRRVAEWFDVEHQQIFDFIGERLHLFSDLSMRLYTNAQELKTARIHWRRVLLGRCLSGPTRLVAELKADPSYATEQDRVKAFIAMGGGCRATYFNHAKKLQPSAPPPRIVLKNAAPRQTHGMHDLIALLKRRSGGRYGIG